MAKIVNISEIHPTLGFTEFDILEKYRKSFNESELGKLHSVFPFECMEKPQACRTLIRLALIRKPWSCGVRVTLPHYRYSCLHLLFHTLHQISRFGFDAEWNAPLPHFRAQNFGGILDARLLSTLCRSTSELLRTL